jgi:hypothetical protein
MMAVTKERSGSMSWQAMRRLRMAGCCGEGAVEKSEGDASPQICNFQKGERGDGLPGDQRFMSCSARNGIG